MANYYYFLYYNYKLPQPCIVYIITLLIYYLQIVISVPSQRQRVQILRVQCECLPLVEDVDIADLADLTAGYVGADLVHLCHEASYLAITASNTLKVSIINTIE